MYSAHFAIWIGVEGKNCYILLTEIRQTALAVNWLLRCYWSLVCTDFFTLWVVNSAPLDLLCLESFCLPAHCQRSAKRLSQRSEVPKKDTSYKQRLRSSDYVWERGAISDWMRDSTVHFPSWIKKQSIGVSLLLILQLLLIQAYTNPMLLNVSGGVNCTRAHFRERGEIIGALGF